MPRIDPIDPEDAEPRVRAVLEAQASQWGAPLGNHLTNAHLFSDRTLAALDYADLMTVSDPTDEIFGVIRSHFSDLEIVELTAVIAWENASARFNRALRVESQGLWT